MGVKAPKAILGLSRSQRSVAAHCSRVAKIFKKKKRRIHFFGQGSAKNIWANK